MDNVRDLSKINDVVDRCINLSYNQFEGCCFAIESKHPLKKYFKSSNQLLYKKNARRLSVLNKKDLSIIRRLAGLDGAMIINNKGELMHVGATLVHSRNFINHGKRHAFALGTTKVVNDVVCILASEEDRKIRTFRNGVCVAEIDGLTKMPINTRRKVTEILTSRTTGLIVGSGIAASVLTLNLIPAIVTISGAQIITYVGFDKIKEIFSKH